MRLVIQRVSRAAVRVGDETVGSIGPGLLILLGIHDSDDSGEAQRLATKTADLRIFSDSEGRFNLSVIDTEGSALVVSQFTLYADVRRGRRPSFTAAARPEVAEPLVEAFCAALAEHGVNVARGRFGAKMEVELTNDGPVTLVIDSTALQQPRRSKD